MGTVSTLATFQNLVRPVDKMNKSSLACTGKLDQDRFSVQRLLRLYMLCDNGDLRYFCHVREDMAWALFEFYKYKNAPV